MLERTIGKVMGKHSILVGIFVIIVAIIFIILIVLWLNVI